MMWPVDPSVEEEDHPFGDDEDGAEPFDAPNYEEAVVGSLPRQSSSSRPSSASSKRR